MALIMAILFGLNMVQLNKDASRCKKSEFKAEGCSVFVKMNMNKK